MKKIFLLIPVFGLMLACSGRADQAEAEKQLQEQTDSIELSTQELDELVQSSEEMIDTVQSEIDELLNDI